MIVLNPDGFADLSKYSGNPFLDAMTDLRQLFSTIALLHQAKPFIDKYSDTSLSDLKDLIKANLPDAIDEKGNINFAKLQELASNGDEIAQHILTIRQQRELLANAPLGGKLAAIYDDAVRGIISGENLRKDLNILKKSKLFDEILEKANISDEAKALLAMNKEKFLSDPERLKYVINLFKNLQQQPNK